IHVPVKSLKKSIDKRNGLPSFDSEDDDIRLLTNINIDKKRLDKANEEKDKMEDLYGHLCGKYMKLEHECDKLKNDVMSVEKMQTCIDSLSDRLIIRIDNLLNTYIDSLSNRLIIRMNNLVEERLCGVND